MHTQTGGRGSLPTQCGSKPGHGPDGLYCKHHALEVDPPASFTAWQVNTYYSHGIEEIQVIHATEKMVTLKGGRKQARDTQYYRVFDTRDEAVTFARNRAEAEIRGAEQTIKVAQKFIKSLEP